MSAAFSLYFYPCGLSGLAAVEQLHEACQGYDNWLRLAFALSDGLGEAGRQIFDRLSQMNADYDTRECNRLYDNCMKGHKGGITIATFFQMARDLANVDLKEIQFHPVTDAVLHVDFLEVNDQKPITIGIPVKLTGLAQGVRDGGRMNLSIRKIEVKAPYQQIPEHLDIDVTALQIGKSIKVGQLNFEGLEIVTGKEVIVCSIKMTRAALSAAAQAQA